jgi:ribonuclease D
MHQTETLPRSSVNRGDKAIAIGYTPSAMRVVTTSQDLVEACQQLSTADFVAVDTEFMREQTYWPELCLIQMASRDHEFIVDPLAGGIELGPFYDLMADASTVKVFHAARQDIEIIVDQADLVPQPLFDTQIAAMVCGFGESTGYVNLVKKITNRDLDKSSQFTDWKRRPLTDKQLHYAIGDVTHLRDVYAFLKSELEQSGRSGWLAEEMSTLSDKGTYITRPEDAWKRLKLRVKNRKALAILIELAQWREKAAQKQNVPRGRILRDEALYDIVNQAPVKPEQLSRLRSLSDGFSRSQRGREIIEQVRTALDRDPTSLPAIKKNRQMTPQASATVELLKVLLKSCAAKNNVAPKLIANTDDLERIAMGEQNIKALQGWRHELFGELALRLAKGDLALGLRDGEVMTVDTGHTAVR